MLVEQFIQSTFLIHAASKFIFRMERISFLVVGKGATLGSLVMLINMSANLYI